MIVDSQVHTWSKLAEGAVPSAAMDAASIRPRELPFSADELWIEMSAAKVDRAVIYPPRWSSGGLNEAVEACNQHPDRLALVVMLALTHQQGEPVAEVEPGILRVGKGQVAELLKVPHVLGARIYLNASQWPPGEANGGVPLDSADHWVWDELAKAGIPAVLGPAAANDRILEIAKQHPDLKIIVDHLALSTEIRDEEVTSRIGDVLQFASLPNVGMKVCHLPRLSTEPYPYRKLHDFVRRILDGYGRERVFWGTNFTITRAGYGQSVSMVTDEMKCLSQEDREWFMGRAILQWLDWK